MTTPRKWRHNELIEDLHAKLRATGDRMCWVDMQLGPSGSPRPDLYTIAKSYTKPAPLAYEIKISVSDFRSDITSGKWQKYLRFACGVIFCVPAGMIGKEDIPTGCGLMVRGEESWRTVKAPTLQRMPELDRDAWMKLLIDGIKRESERQRIDQRAQANAWHAQQALRKKFGDEFANLVHRWSQSTVEAVHAVEAAELRHRIAMENLKRHQDAEYERARSEKAQIDAVREGICKVLGLDADASMWQIQEKARRLRMQIDKDEELMRAAQLIKSIAGDIHRYDAALLPLLASARHEGAPGIGAHSGVGRISGAQRIES